MAHKLIDDRVVVDWTAGGPEGDRLNLLSAYRDFIIEIQDTINRHKGEHDLAWKLKDIFNKWTISTGNQIDDIPRIWIKRPEQ